MEFLAVNSDSTDPFFRTNMRYGICSHCEIFQTCQKEEAMPIISPMANYVMKYHGEIERGFAVYPQPGGWENQPVWFLRLLDTMRSRLALIEKRKQDGGK